MAIKDTMRGGANAGRGDNPHPQITQYEHMPKESQVQSQPEKKMRWDSNALNAKKGTNTGDPETYY